MFHETLQFLGLLKSHLQFFKHGCQREAGRRLRREWLQRKSGRENIFVDLNWCSACHQSGCRLE